MRQLTAQDTAHMSDPLRQGNDEEAERYLIIITFWTVYLTIFVLQFFENSVFNKHLILTVYA
jgi:hypothetical protein